MTYKDYLGIIQAKKEEAKKLQEKWEKLGLYGRMKRMEFYEKIKRMEFIAEVKYKGGECL